MLHQHVTMNTHPINKTFLIILLGILAALGPFSIDMYLPAFRQIADDFNTNEKQVAFTLTSYFVGIAVGQLIYGPIVDKYGRKKPLLVGLSIYALAALGCAWAPNLPMLVAMRLLQALGGCVGMVASASIISDVYEKNRRAKAFSSVMLVMGVAPLIAPSIGSIFLEKGHWSYIFFFLAAFSAFVIALIGFFLPETSQFIHNNKLRITEISRNYWDILKNRTFLSYTIAGSLSNAILFAYISSAAFVFLTVYKLDKATFSILFAINAGGLISGSYLNGYLTNHFNYIRIANTAARILSIMSVVFMSLVYFIASIPFQWVALGLFLTLFLTGLINPNAIAASLAPFSKNVGAASALGGGIRMGFGALIAAMVGLINQSGVTTMVTIITVVAVLSMIMLASVAPPTAKKKRKLVMKKVARQQKFVEDVRRPVHAQDSQF